MNLGITPNFTMNYKKSQNVSQPKISFGGPGGMHSFELIGSGMSSIAREITPEQIKLNQLRKGFQLDAVNNLMKTVAEKIGFPVERLSVREHATQQGVFISHNQFTPEEIDNIALAAKREISAKLYPKQDDNEAFDLGATINSAHEANLLAEPGNHGPRLRNDEFDGNFLQGASDGLPDCFDNVATANTKITSPFYFDTRVRSCERKQYENMRNVAHVNYFGEEKTDEIYALCKKAPDGVLVVNNGDKTFQVTPSFDPNKGCPRFAGLFGFTIDRIK